MAELRVKSTGTIKLFENDNTSNVTIASPASLGGDRTVTLPDSDVNLGSLGKVLQVVQSTFGYFSTTSTSFVDTGLTVDITPSSSSNKVLVFCTIGGGYCGAADTGLIANIVRDSTEIICFETIGGYTGDTSVSGFGGTSALKLDSPSSTSALTYKMQTQTSVSGAAAIGNWVTGSERALSTITVMEIAA